MKNKFPYHSALKRVGDLPIDESLNRFVQGNNQVFTYDMTNEIPQSFFEADMIYAELAWKAGFKKYMDKVDKLGNFEFYVRSVEKIITTLKIAAYLIIGKHHLKILNPHRIRPIKQHDYNAILASYYTDYRPIGKTNYDVMDEICKLDFTTILNFNCGYGNIVRYALAHSKNFICSDINPHCVYFVAKSYMGYQDEKNGSNIQEHLRDQTILEKSERP